MCLCHNDRTSLFAIVTTMPLTSNGGHREQRGGKGIQLITPRQAVGHAEGHENAHQPD